jgi:hypothetical protein
MTSALERKTSWQDRLSSQWETIKLPAMMLAVGLVAGPLFSSYMGWQVTRGTAEKQSMASGIDQQALICAFNARATVADSVALSWSDRRDLADKFAVMPGRTVASDGVASACAQKLSAAG